MDEVDDRLRAEALGKFLPLLQAYYERHFGLPRPDYDARIGEGDELLRSLQRAGCATTSISAACKAELNAVALPLAENLHARLEDAQTLNFKETQQVLAAEQHPAVYAAVEQILGEAHVLEVFQAYSRRRVVLKDVTVQVTTDRTTAASWGPLDADGLPSPRTRYLHIDSAMFPQVKVLIYLTPVGPDQGPFRYVEGSHRDAEDFELMVRKVNDREGFQNKLFMALPEPFRMTTLLGNHLDPDAPEARALLAREQAFDDGASDLILFDFNGAHRGGFVRKGRRYMLQCHFTAARR
jgi:hypothetical protein